MNECRYKDESKSRKKNKSFFMFPKIREGKKLISIENKNRNDKKIKERIEKIREGKEKRGESSSSHTTVFL